MAAGNNYLVQSCEIQVTRHDGSIAKIFRANEITIDTSFDTLTDTAVVTLPYDNRWISKDKNGYNQLSLISGETEGFFSIGDEIQIFYGYNYCNLLQFRGVITEIEPRTPLKLICQDNSWYLKKNRLHWESPGEVHLKDILPMLVADTPVEIHPLTYEQDIIFGKLTFRNISTAKLLDEWRSMGLISYIDMETGKLVIGRSYFSSSAGMYTSTLTKKDYTPPRYAVYENVIEDNLKVVYLTTQKTPKRSKPRDPRQNVMYGDTPASNRKTLEASGVAIRAVSLIKNNSLEITLVLDPKDPSKLIVVDEYDERLSKSTNEQKSKDLTKAAEAKGIYLENYFIKTQNEFNLTREQLIQAAADCFPKYLISGLEGSFTTFGDYTQDSSRNLRPATTIYFIDPHNPEKNAEYMIKSIRRSFSSSGIRQVVEIPYRIKNITK